MSTGSQTAEGGFRHLGSQAQVGAGVCGVRAHVSSLGPCDSTPDVLLTAAAGRLGTSLSGWNRSRTCAHHHAWLSPSLSTEYHIGPSCMS